MSSLIELSPWGYVATDTLRPLLKALHTARAEVANRLWLHHEVEVSIVTETGYALKTDPPRLSAEGKKVRQAIEDAINSRTSAWLAELEDESQPRFIEALPRLPD